MLERPGPERTPSPPQAPGPGVGDLDVGVPLRDGGLRQGRSQPETASLSRGSSGVSSPGGCSEGAGLLDSRPHSPLRPAQARRAWAEERTAAVAALVAAGAAPRGGAAEARPAT